MSRYSALLLAVLCATAAPGVVSTAAAQARASDAERWEVPRTPDGHPDLQGNWVFAAVEAANMIGFVSLNEVLRGLIEFGGQVLLGLLIFGIGLWLAGLAATTVRDSGVGQAETLAIASRVSILVLAGAMALRQMGLGERIIELAFGLSLGAVAVSAALAFGLGSRDIAAEQVRRWRDGARG